MTSFTQQIVRESPSSSQISIFNPLEHPDWEGLINQWPQAGGFHQTAWLQVLFDTYGYQPLAIGIKRNEAIVALAVLMEIDSFLTGKRGISLPFTDSCNLLGEKARFPELVDQLKATGTERSWKYFEIRGPIDPVEAIPSTTFFQHKLKLQASPSEALFSGLSSANRRAIRKSERSELVLSDSSNPEAMHDFYFLIQLSRKRLGLPPQPYRFFQNLYKRILLTGNGKLWIARHQGRPIAGALFLHYGNTVTYKFGASDKRSQELRANNRVMWEAIQSYSRDGFTELDFGRTSIGNEGLRRFKLGWGATETTENYVRFDFSQKDWISTSDQSSGWHNRIFRLMPTPMLRAVGSLIYKHVA